MVVGFCSYFATGIGWCGVAYHQTLPSFLDPAATTHTQDYLFKFKPASGLFHRFAAPFPMLVLLSTAPPQRFHVDSALASLLSLRA